MGSSDNLNDVSVSTETCGSIMQTREVNVSRVTQNVYVEKINSGGFFEGFSITLPHFIKKGGGWHRDTGSVEMCMCV